MRTYGVSLLSKRSTLSYSPLWSQLRSPGTSLNCFVSRLPFSRTVRSMWLDTHTNTRLFLSGHNARFDTPTFMGRTVSLSCPDDNVFLSLILESTFNQKDFRSKELDIM